jgi:hypothetical protein
LAVFVVDKHKRPLMPCSEKRARQLLTAGRARIHRLVPFVIRLVDRDAATCQLQPILLGIDPGSKTTGLAVCRVEATDAGPLRHLLQQIELAHRGHTIHLALTSRASLRRTRRGRNLRYRAPRFNNRTKPKGWLPPSLRSRVDNVTSWLDRLQRWVPITDIALERVKFDMQALQNPAIKGEAYQRGTLYGFELREYILTRDRHQCVYCDEKDVPLNLDHVVPRAAGGSDRPSNLVCSCIPCNSKKAAQPLAVFLKHNPVRLARIQRQLKLPLKDAAAVNATRNAIFVDVLRTGLPVETGSGGRTKYNRTRLGLPKTHALDAACVGNVAGVDNTEMPVLAIKATGRGTYQRTRVDKYGFPRGYLMRQKAVKGFQTGDLVKAAVPKGKRAGTHQGRVAVRANGNFNIQTGTGLVTDIHWRHCQLLQRADGYGYHQVSALTHSRDTSRIHPHPDGIPARKPSRVGYPAEV